MGDFRYKRSDEIRDESFESEPPTSHDGKSLMEASTEHRIRLLAIAIEGMDTVDAALLLECLPESISTQVRRKIEDLGDVSEQERRLAWETIEGLMESEPEPESQRLSEFQEVSASQDFAQTPVDAPQETHGLPPKDSAERSLLLESQPIEVVASVLSEQRPIVIATVLRHVPSRLGQSIVQRLEHGLAKEALDWIPKLAPTSELVLSEVLSGIESQVQEVSIANQSKDQRDEKVRELLAVLKVSDESTTLSFFEGVERTEMSNVNAIPEGQPSTFGQSANPSSLGPASSESVPAFVIPLRRKTGREELLDQLLSLDDLDLLRVFYSHSIDDVKRFLAGANKAMRLRIEKLTAPDALKRLRRELAAVPIVEEKVWREIASRIEQTANELQPEPSLRIPA